MDTSVKHVILIRHPREVCLSTVILNGEPAPYMQYNIAVPVEQHFKALLSLMEFFEGTGRSYMVLDSSKLDEIMFERTVETLCKFGDIPFDVEKIRNMDTSETLPPNWWVPLGLDTTRLSNFFDSTQNSVVRCYDDALKLGKYGQRQSKVNKESLSEENKRTLQETLKLSMPVYDELKKCELKQY
ncbi:uncharacterized protein LOC142349413 isoform X2 [Convolutriloba macropyga]|uniref:uncharacterized protein LOC142349413 isoform X2 n=1 Tax=Convolutriloba macropyga TaxID=536237 RepID=UPI003F51B0D2